MNLLHVGEEAARLGLHIRNRHLLDYWLTLARCGCVPSHTAFDPVHAGEALRGCALFDVIIGNAVICRLAGTVFQLAFGTELAGQDWLAKTLPAHRRQRLIRFSAVAQGAIGIARRMVPERDQGRPQIIEELLLPFAAVGSVTPVLVHSSWRPQGEEWLGVDGTAGLALASEFHLIALEPSCSHD
ncbi:MAG: PAS domain-containing protein [Alphaproteobacteria bacterium]|nr:PAS domain-containing protein [Alphaproteobacteria bacterium]